MTGPLFDDPEPDRTCDAELIIEFGEWLQNQQTEREHDE